VGPFPIPVIIFVDGSLIFANFFKFLEAAAKLQWGFIGIGDRLKGKTEVWIEDYFSEHWQSAPDRALQRTRMSNAADFGIR
jgi:hypothetical protein